MKPIFSRLLPKGSVLVFSLIILSVMLVTALSLLSSAVLDQRASLSTADSTRSFQIADSGVEQTLYQIYKKDPGTIDDIASGMGLSCDAGAITDASSGWTVRFYDADDNRLSNCDADRSDIAALKSEGSAKGTTRAVEVAVAQASADFETGMIIMWSGDIDEIPEGWALCDGSNGTPNLSDRFVVGAGHDFSVGNEGGEREHTLTVSEMPSHRHYVVNGDSHVGGLSSSTTVCSNSDHGNGGSYYLGGTGTIANMGLSSPSGNGQSFSVMPPYLALAYIMKIDD